MDKMLKNMLNEYENCRYPSHPVYDLLDSYYQILIYPPTEEDYDDSSDPFPKELLLPLPERESGIYVLLEHLFHNGFSANDYQDSFSALGITVGSGDYLMTEYLLQNGADIHTWPDMFESTAGYHQNDYLEIVECADIHDLHDPLYREAYLRTAQVLADYGKFSNSFGLWLSIDKAGKASFR